MPANYPELEWEVNRDGGQTALTEDFALVCALRKGGEDAGTWSAILNASSLTSGGGKFGYRFDDEAHAKAALEEAMREEIDARIIHAEYVLRTYT